MLGGKCCIIRCEHVLELLLLSSTATTARSTRFMCSLPCWRNHPIYIDIPDGNLATHTNSHKASIRWIAFAFGLEFAWGGKFPSKCECAYFPTCECHVTVVVVVVVVDVCIREASSSNENVCLHMTGTCDGVVVVVVVTPNFHTLFLARMCARYMRSAHEV